MQVVFFALFVLSSGRRVFDTPTNHTRQSSPDRAQSPRVIRNPKDKYPLSLADYQSFNISMGSVLAKELLVPPGWTMTLELQERRKAFKPNMYDVFVAGYNGTLSDLVPIGYVNSKHNLSPWRTHQDFVDVDGKKISRMHWGKRPSLSTTARAYIVKPKKRYNGTYYTFEKLSLWGDLKGDWNFINKEETVNVYHGKCNHKNSPECRGLAFRAVGHKLGFKFNFYKGHTQERVAYMSMVKTQGRGIGKKERYRLTVLPGADVLMLTQLVAFIDLCNNDEAAKDD